MKLSIGIIGLPNVGKSTLFNILTKQEVESANYPFATVDPNVGVVPVPDERLNKIHDLYTEKEKKNTTVEFVDIAGLVKNASEGEGLGNQFLSHIREVDMVIHLIRTFKGDEVAHVEGETHPLRDFKVIEEELRKKDLETVKKRLDKTSKPEDKKRLKEIKKRLQKEKLIQERDDLVRELNLLSSKPQLVFLNGKSKNISKELKDKLNKMNLDYLVENLSTMEDPSSIIKGAYDLLDIITFFTIGKEQVEAWKTKKGSTAPEAAGEVHSDFEDQFIKAEVINWKNLIKADSWKEAKNRGEVRTKGKDYVVQDGDVIYFKI
ncbi:MAG: DUF933 domain-containing protein [Candidatus Magasanikbacteria bacterium]